MLLLPVVDIHLSMRVILGGFYDQKIIDSFRVECVLWGIKENVGRLKLVVFTYKTHLQRYSEYIEIGSSYFFIDEIQKNCCDFLYF